MRVFRYVLMAFLFSAGAHAAALELTTEDDPPHNMLKEGKLVGLSTEKLEEAFRRIGEPEHATLMPWARAYQSALNTRDVCVYSAGRTPEREALFQWVGPIATLDWVLYARADDTRTHSINRRLCKRSIWDGALGVSRRTGWPPVQAAQQRATPK